ncbi:MAG: PD-(D/E)XK nuclease family protein [Elusimicrobia bacterium]|nr:PD-(D/E)XK nuclease family protein [Elusimicrobiota bacterium]
MPLKILTGSFPALEKAFVDRLRADPPGLTRRVAVVTTSQQMADRLQQLLTLESGLSFANLHFQTLHTLSLEVLRRSGAALPTIVNDELFHERLMERILLEEGRLPPDRARSLAGAHRAAVRDLLEAGVEGAVFREHFTDLEIPGNAKLQRLLDLTDRVRETLESLHVATSSDLARRAASVLERSPDLLAPYDELMYYGFYDLNGAQSEFFDAVSRAASVTLFFPCQSGRPVWSFAQRFLDVKLGAGGAVVTALPETAEDALSGAAGNLFDPALAADPPIRNLRFVGVSGDRDDLWRAAKEIRRLKEEHPDARWSDFGVVARGLEGRSDTARDVFEAEAIPLSISDGGPLLGHPAAKLAVHALAFPLRPRDRDLLLDIVDSPALAETALPAAARAAAREALGRSGPRWDTPVHASPGGDPLPEGLRGENPPEALIALVKSLSRPAPDGLRTWSARAGDARERLAALVRRDADNEAVWARLDSLLENLAALDLFSPPVSEEEFAETYREAVARARLPGTPDGGVRALGAMEARGERFRWLFLIGLNEGVFPRAVSEDPLLTDDLRRVLRDPGGYWILPKMEGYDEEKLLFGLLAGSAREGLTAVYARSREDGRAEIPSLYLRELARATGHSLEAADQIPRSPRRKWNDLPSEALTPEEAGLVDLLDGRSPPAEWKTLVARAGALASWGPPILQDGLVGRPTAWLGRLEQRGISPSALETYVSCPFEFFMSRVLRIPSPSPIYDGARVSAAFLGKIQHEILFQTYGGFRGGPVPTAEEAVGRVREKTRALFDALRRSPQGPPPLLWDVLADGVLSRLTAFVRRDVDDLRATGRRPVELEWERSAPHPTAGFRWNGRLDRVDENPATGARTVVDYKNRSRRESLSSRILKGHVHQAPAYLDLLVGRDGGAAPSAGVRYEYLATNEFEEFTAEEWRDARAAVHEAQKALFDGLAGGVFAIRPSEGPEGHCGYCSFAAACRKAHGPSRARAERAVGDGAIESSRPAAASAKPIKPRRSKGGNA